MALTKTTKKEKEWRRVLRSKSKVKRYCFELGLPDPWEGLEESHRRPEEVSPERKKSYDQ